MNILYVGDIMGEPGVEVVRDLLPDLRKDHAIDLVIAQAENVTEGKGITPKDFQRIREIGVDFCTGGNWSLKRESIIPLMERDDMPIIRPANYLAGTPGRGFKYATTPRGQILVISLVGHIVGRDADVLIDNPLRIVDAILEQEADKPRVGCVVNFHGDFSSEKVVIGHYLDGRVTLVVGDHWHVPTADGRVLPGGTAHVTDVGMCGALDASLGVAYESVIPRWRDDAQTRNVLELHGQRQFNAVFVRTDSRGLANSVERIQKYL